MTAEYLPTTLSKILISKSCVKGHFEMYNISRDHCIFCIQCLHYFKFFYERMKHIDLKVITKRFRHVIVL